MRWDHGLGNQLVIWVCAGVGRSFAHKRNGNVVQTQSQSLGWRHAVRVYLSQVLFASYSVRGARSLTGATVTSCRHLFYVCLLSLLVLRTALDSVLWRKVCSSRR